MCYCGVLHSTTSCPFQARTEYLRKKARGTLQSASGGDEGDGAKGEIEAVEHLNLFPLEESDLKKGNEEYLKEKKDEKVFCHFSCHLYGCQEVKFLKHCSREASPCAIHKLIVPSGSFVVEYSSVGGIFGTL